MQRRELLKYGATGLTGLGTGYVLMDQTVQTANAAVTMGTLSVSDASETTDDGTISNVTAEVSGDWEYDLPSGESPDTWTVTLTVTDGENVGELGSTTGDAMYLSNNDSYSVAGSITDTDVYSTEDFAATEPGTRREVTLGIVLVFAVTSENGEPLARSQLEDTGTVSVTNDGLQASDYGEISGTGGLGIEG